MKILLAAKQKFAQHAAHIMGLPAGSFQIATRGEDLYGVPTDGNEFIHVAAPRYYPSPEESRHIAEINTVLYLRNIKPTIYTLS